MKNILFRVNSSSQIGIGHLMRCLTLAKIYKNSAVTFACEDLNGNLNKKILKEGFNLKVLKNNSKKELNSVIRKLKIDFLVIDHYEINCKFEKFIKKENNLTLLSFDDMYQKHYCDILLNHNIYAKEEYYKNLVPSFCELRCGKKYTLIRDEFSKEKKKRRKRKKEIFVSIGGTDHLELNIKILKIVEKCHKDCVVNIITTSANKNLNRLKSYCKDKKTINLCIDSKKIAQLMNRSLYAIVTPSVVVNEVMFMKLPFIAIKTAHNQHEMYKYLKVKKLDVLKKFSSTKLEKNLLKKIK